MLDANLTQQLKTYLANLREPIELVATLGEGRKSDETRELLQEIAALHDLVTARFDGEASRKPSFTITRVSDPAASVEFAGLPMGHEFTSLVLALLWAGGHPPKVSDEVLAQARETDPFLGVGGAADHEAGLAVVGAVEARRNHGVQIGDLAQQRARLARLGIVAQRGDEFDRLAQVGEILLQLLLHRGVEHGAAPKGWREK